MPRPSSSLASALLALCCLGALACCWTAAPVPDGSTAQAPITPEPSESQGSGSRASLPRAPGPIADDRPDAEAPELPPPGEATAKLAARVAALEAELSRYGVEEKNEGGSYDVVLVRPARPLLRQLKDATVALLSARLAELPDELVPTREQLSLALSGAFARAPGDRDETGAIVALSAERPAGHEGRYVVVVTYRLPCGSDDALWVLERKGPSVRPALAVRADDYASISSGRLGSAWAVSAPDSSGNYLVAAAHAHPWCTSLWRGIDYQAFSPGPDADHPRRLARHADSAYVSSEVADLQASPDGFEVRWASWDELGDGHTRSYVHRWQRGPSGLARVTPEVRLPQDLLAQLLDESWPSAEGLVAPPARAAARALQARLARKRPGKRGVFTVDGHRPGYDTSELPSPVGVEWTCEGCEGFPAKVSYRAERQGGGWIITGLEAR